LLGALLGPYRIESELGSGGMGSVYVARVEEKAPELEIGTRVAVKVIHPHLLETPNAFKRFLLEARLGRQVRHPNVVSTYDCDAVRVDGKNHHFLVMEYVEGQTLRALLDELGTVPEDLCRHFGRQIASGLRAIHEAGAVHRDLKPENVLVTPEHEVKVMDLGVARLLADPLRLSHSGHFVGSLLYAPPEAFRSGGSEIDGRGDLHSLGVLLYEIATGRHPYRHDDMQVVLRMVLSQEPARAGEVNPQLSPFFEEVIHTLCAKKADDRFAGAAALLEVLEEGERSRWWEARSRALTSRTRRPLRRVRIQRETGLYGREEELAVLQAAYERARDGDGQVLLVDGEAGVGKTRLIDDFATKLQREGEDLNFLFGSYPPGGAATVAGAFNTAFREHFGASGLRESLEPYLEVTPLMAPAFAAFLRGETPPPGQEPLTKDSLQTVFIHATHGLAAERPTIILIDDLHFAPAEGRALFAALALAIPGHRVLLVGTMRAGVPPTWAANVERHEHAQRLSLRRLGPKDLMRLLEDAFGSERLAARLGHEIARKSDGNPFFAFEILRSLRENGQIRQDADGSWSTTEAVTVIRVPSSVTDMVHARLAGLDEPDANVLEVAACCGYRFDPLLLPRVLGLDEVDVLRRLGRIERLHHLVRSTGRLCTFDHHQVQETLYAGLSELLREQYHGKIADVMEARAAARKDAPGELDGPECVELCDHALKGGRTETALAHLGPALDHLEEGYLHEAAIELADVALAAPGLLEGEERCRLLLRKTERLNMIGRREEQEEAIREASRLAAGTGLESRVHQVWGEYYNAVARYEEALGSFEQARSIAAEHGDQRAEAAALGRIGSVNSKLGRTREATGQFEASIALAQSIGDRQAEAVATGNLGLSHFDVGEYDEAERLMKRHLALGQEIGNRRSQSIATGNLGVLYAEWGRPEEARAHMARKLEIAREIGDRMGEAVATANLGMMLHGLGRFDEARSAYERCIEIVREIGARDGEANAAGNLGMVFYSLGRYEKAADWYRRAVTIGNEIGDTMGEADALSNLGTLEVALGCWDPARETLDRSVSLAREVDATRPETYALHGLALLAEERGDLDGADDLHTQVQERWTRMGAKEALAETHVAKARLAIRRGRLEAAATNLDTALELCRATQVPGTILLATVLRAQLPDGDAASARDALDEHAGRVGAAESMEAQFRLFEITGTRPHLDEARRILETLVENAPADCRASMRQRVRLHREILEASTPAGDAPLRA
jgi:tetratricopeptide (TPR) repeat protein